MNNKTFKLVISFLAVYIIWGSTYLAIRVIVENGGPPFFAMGSRFILAAILLYLYMIIKRKYRMTKKQFINNSFVGILLFTGGTGMVAWAEKYIPSGIACVLVSLLPVWFLIFDMMMNKSKKPEIKVWLGVIMGFVGILVLVGFKDLTSLQNIPYLPFIIIILATILWSYGSVLSPRLDKPKNNSLNLSVQMFAGGIANFIVGWAVGEVRIINSQVFVPESILALSYLVVFGSLLAMSAFTYLIENVNPGMVSTYSYINPIVALFLGWLILNEEINSHIIIASTLIITGVALIKLGNTKKENNRPPKTIIKWNRQKAA